MPARDTVLGIVVLGVLLGGGLWASGRGPSGRAPSGGGRSTTRSVSPGADSGETKRPGAVTEAAVPDVTMGDGSVDDGALRVVLSITPRPPFAVAKQRVRVRIEAGGEPRAFDGGRISFAMTMPMGDHRYTLVPAADGWQEAEVVLPTCGSGSSRWYAHVEGVVDGRPVAAEFRFDVRRPGGAPEGGP